MKVSSRLFLFSQLEPACVNAAAAGEAVMQLDASLLFSLTLFIILALRLPLCRFVPVSSEQRSPLSDAERNASTAQISIEESSSASITKFILKCICGNVSAHLPAPATGAEQTHEELVSGKRS